MDYEELFKNEAFQKIDKEKIDKLRNFLERVKGKTNEQIVVEMMLFSKTFGNGNQLSSEERDALITCIISSLDNENREKFGKMLSLMENFM